MDYLYYLFVILGFLSVALFLEGVYLAWNAYKGPEVTRIERRLRALSAGAGAQDAPLVKERLLAKTPALMHLLLKIPRIHHLDRLLQQSGLSWSVSVFLGLSLLAAGVVGAVPLVLNLPPLAAAIAAASAGLAPLVWILRCKRLRLEAIERELPDALDLMGRAMLAGHAFPSALKMVADEMPDPVAEEFRSAFSEINYGIAVPDALANLTARVPSPDLRYFVISVLIQRESGGNLGELLGNISSLIRARLKLVATVRVLSAEGRLSAIILTVLPVILGVVINLINPGFLAVVWDDSLGRRVVWSALALMLFGIWWMRRIIHVRV